MVAWDSSQPDSAVRSLSLSQLSDWERADPFVAVERLRASVGAPRSVWSNDGSLSPVDFYCYLKIRFGAPNGPAMALKSSTSDNLIHWEYVITVGPNLLLITGNTSATVFVCIGQEAVELNDWHAVAKALAEDMSSRRAQIDAERQRLERWQVFVNPYRRLELMVETLLQRLNGLDLTEPSSRWIVASEDEGKRLLSSLKRWCENVDENRLLGGSLRMLLPVLGEAFVNLLIFSLGKREVRHDDRLYESVIRQNIDVRIKALHLNCDGFARPVDASAPAFGGFLRVMDARNNLLHGNVDPRRLKSGEVFFDGVIPLFQDEQSQMRRLLQWSRAGFEREQAVADADAVQTFVQFVLACLTADVRRLVETVMLSMHLGWRADRSRLGVLFPEVVGESIMTLKRK